MLSVYLSALNSRAEQDAFQTLYENSRYRMLWVAQRIVGDPLLAEDAVQEAFLYLADHFETLSARYTRGLEGYLYQCVQCRAVNLMRQQGREESYEAWMECSGREQAALPEGSVGRVAAALGRLPKDCGAVLELFCTGWSAAEIAEQTGLSLRTVHRRLNRARELMRKELEEDGGADG